MESRFHIDYNFIHTELSFGDIRLIQLGTRHCAPGEIVERHLHHNWLELTVVTSGAGTVRINDTVIAVREGDIHLSFPAEFHSLAAAPDTPLCYDYFSFHTANATYLADIERIMQQFADPKKRIIHSNTLRTRVREAIAQFNGDTELPYRAEMLGAQFLQIFISLVRHFKNDTRDLAVFNATHTQKFCFALMHYIDTHIYTMKNAGELADLTNYNYSYLSNLFHSATGQTLSFYFQKKRLETAAELLHEKDLQITQIAQMLQYSSLYAFSKAFRLRYGISPRTYRLQGGTAPAPDESARS